MNEIHKDMNDVDCGGVIQDTRGEWIGGFAKYLERCGVFVAELWGSF